MNTKNGMKCVCGETALPSKTNIEGFSVRAWRCKKCGEEYIDSADAEFVLLYKKMQKHPAKAKLGMLGNSYFIRIPKEIAEVMHLTKGKKTELVMKDPHSIIISVL